MVYELTAPGDTNRQFYDADRDCLVNQVNTDPISALCYEHRKYDGFTPDRGMRLVAHIELDTVKLLAALGDSDAYAYFYEGDEKARDRMIEHYPEYFRACYGGI